MNFYGPEFYGIYLDICLQAGVGPEQKKPETFPGLRLFEWFVVYAAVMAIFLGFAFATFGSVNRSTPSLRFASIFS